MLVLIISRKALYLQTVSNLIYNMIHRPDAF